jgi:flagellar FliL protein
MYQGPVPTNGPTMTDITSDPDTLAEPLAPRRMIPVVAGGVLAITAGVAGFFTVQAGVFDAAPGADDSVISQPGATFVPVDPLIISLGANTRNRHLRFLAQLEVTSRYEDEVRGLMPRVVDALNGYLRAVDLADLENPAALVRLRAQMLRRVQMVSGEGRVRDLLIMEFVLN